MAIYYLVEMIDFAQDQINASNILVVLTLRGCFYVYTVILYIWPIQEAWNIWNKWNICPRSVHSRRRAFTPLTERERVVLNRDKTKKNICVQWHFLVRARNCVSGGVLQRGTVLQHYNRMVPLLLSAIVRHTVALGGVSAYRFGKWHRNNRTWVPGRWSSLH